MKFIRFMDRNEQEQYGIVSEDGEITLIEGTPLEGFAETSSKISSSEIKRYLPPVDPVNVIAIGLNYKGHAAESGMKLPEAPVIFVKTTNTVCAHRDTVLIPKMAPNEVDYEAELAVVIGKKAKDVPVERALDYVLGFCVAQDVSARDCQLRLDIQWARGKSFDTFCPLGPYLVTDADPGNLRITLRLNGETMQDSLTSDLIFSVPELISYLSRNMTLFPGTVILTGTPEGVGMGRDPKVFLKPGDRMEAEIEGLGVLENEVAAEP